MSLPATSRVVYRQNPLEEVICQLRFPTVLTIDADSAKAAEFQAAIRAQYPLYDEKPISAAIKAPPEVQELVSSFFSQGGRIERRFSTEDRKWSVTLTRDFLALTATSYERWEGFARQLRPAIQALQATYAPSFYSRVGLRYRNVIRRSKLGLENVAWADLLQPQIAGVLGSAQIANEISKAVSQATISLGDFESSVRFQHGLMDEKPARDAYAIDSDFFTAKRTDWNHVDDTLAFFNDQARRLFHWCIHERLRAAMGPTTVAG